MAQKNKTHHADNTTSLVNISQPIELSSTAINPNARNARLMKSKVYMVCDLIISHELDILGITESYGLLERTGMTLSSLILTTPFLTMIFIMSRGLEE